MHYVILALTKRTSDQKYVLTLFAIKINIFNTH